MELYARDWGRLKRCDNEEHKEKCRKRRGRDKENNFSEKRADLYNKESI
jgi:hypothetical protein